MPTRKRKPVPARDSYHLPVRTEHEQIAQLGEDLQDAWRALRAALERPGPVKSHTSAKAIMFYRERCFAFVRPKRSCLELSFFLPRALKSGLLHRVEAASKVRWVHVARIVHSDQVEEPLTDWLVEAYAAAAPQESPTPSAGTA